MWTEERLDNLAERRKAIAELIASSAPMTRSVQIALAARFDCSAGAIYRDMQRMIGHEDKPRTYACHQVSSENGRARKLGIPGEITTDEWQALCERYGDRCLKCGTGDRLVIDHVIPLSRGGEHSIRNIQPLCRKCNAKKHATYADYRD